MTSTTAKVIKSVQGTAKTMRQAKESLVKVALQPKTFRYVDQLTNYLRQHFILHEPGRFLIIPKPYGISCLGRKSQGGGVFKDSVYDKDGNEELHELASSSKNDIVLEDCLPMLGRAFNEPKLQFCVGLKRYLSGAIVLPARDEELKHIKNSMQHIAMVSKSSGEYHYRCLAILMGTPPDSEKEGTISGYATFHKSDYIFVPKKASKRAKSGKFAVEGNLHYTVLASKHGCSLVEFGVNKFARHLPRLAFSHILCPILGDPLYSKRVADVNGNKTSILPGRSVQKAKQWFPEQIETRLGLRANDLIKCMPLYCHVYQTTFPRYGWSVGRQIREQDVADLIASVPPPPHFLAMVEALEMNKTLAKFLRGEGEYASSLQEGLEFI